MNAQYIRTDRAIVAAFLRLIAKKPFEKITIQNILDETPINRSSFYTHFRDKYEIAERLQDLVLDKINSESFAFLESYSKNRSKALNMHNDTFQQYRPMLIALLSIKTEKVDLLGKWSDILQQRYMEQYGTGPQKEAEAAVYSGIITQLMLYTVTHDMAPDELLGSLTEIQINVILALLSLENDDEMRDILRNKIDKRTHHQTKTIH